MQVNLTSDAEYTQIARAQKKHACELADRIERGDSLTGLDANFAAVILRGWADNLPERQPRKKGHQSEVAYGDIALLVKAYAYRMSEAAAIRAVAELKGVSETTVKNALRECGNEASALLNMLHPKS